MRQFPRNPGQSHSERGDGDAVIAVEVMVLAGGMYDGRRGGVGVLRLAVPAQIHLALKGLLAQAAGEGLVASVLPHVRDQVGALAEGFGAHNALVRFLAWGQKKHH